MAWVNVDDFPAFDLTAEEEAELAIEEKKQKKMRLYVDEDVPPLATQILREREYNVRDVKEEGRRGLPDETHLADARKQQRILITCDRDFLYEKRFPLHMCSSIVICDFGTGTRDQINDTFHCFLTIEWAPHLFATGVKIIANPSEWTEKLSYEDGSSDRRRFKIHRGQRLIWVDESTR